MTYESQSTILPVVAGHFSDQASAFDALSQTALLLGVRVGAWEVDVIREASNVRLAHYFRPAIVSRIEALQGDDNTVIVIKPSSLSATSIFPPDNSDFRLLGRFAGRIST